MTQKEMLVQLYQWKKESIENDARFKVQMEELVKRFDKQEKAFEKISGELADRKSFFVMMENMNAKLSVWDNRIEEIIKWKHEQEKLNLLEERNNENVSGKINLLLDWKEKTTVRIDALENKNAKAAFSLLKKIGWVALSVIVTAVVAYLIGKFKR
ncbi:MAG: hypothetical protein ACTTKB_04410 [Treponema sp.]